MIGIESAVTGIVTRDTAAKVSAKGKAYVQINIRIGEGEDAQFVNVLAFDTNVIEAAKAGKITRGVQVYAEGRLQVGLWTGDDGRSRIELKMMARYCRLPEIGRHKPRKQKQEKPKAAAPSIVPPDPELNDPIPQW